MTWSAKQYSSFEDERTHRSRSGLRSRQFDRGADFSEVVYVLHCFQKKTRKTNPADIKLAARRYRTLMQEIDYEQ